MVKYKKVKARIYSGLTILRGVCQVCGENCLVCKDKTSSCCGGAVDVFTEGITTKETSTAYGKLRKKPSLLKQIEILEKQEKKCYWCGREFGTYILNPSGQVVQLSIRWDHYLPYSYVGHSRGENFVAACNRCNAHKSAKIVFDEIDEEFLREYLKRIWGKGGWKDIR